MAAELCIIPQKDEPGCLRRQHKQSSLRPTEGRHSQRTDEQSHITDLGISPRKQHKPGSRTCPREDNQEADHLFRLYKTDDTENTEWILNRDWIKYLNKHLGPLKTDLFASPWNAKLSKFFSRANAYQKGDRQCARCIHMPETARKYESAWKLWSAFFSVRFAHNPEHMWQNFYLPR